MGKKRVEERTRFDSLSLHPRKGEGACRSVWSAGHRRVTFAHALLVLGVCSFFGIWSLELGASPAFGPAISVPIDLPRESRPLPAPNLIDQSREDAARKSRGCLECHVGTDEHTMHKSPNVVLGCTDCHGGNPTPGLLMRKAHVQSRHGDLWPGSANPNNSTILLNQESPEFIQFVNPGDLRVADKACGTCHRQEVANVGHSMMRHEIGRAHV